MRKFKILPLLLLLLTMATSAAAQKKTQKTPSGEIEKALKIKEAYYADK